jgi:hypothetical protein
MAIRKVKPEEALKLGLLTGKPGITGEQGIQGPEGPPGRPGEDGMPGVSITGEQGVRGEDGSNGITGINGVSGQPGEKGEKGDTGDTPEHEWNNTRLRFQDPEGEWGKWAELKGQDGQSSGGGGGAIIPLSGSSGGQTGDVLTRTDKAYEWAPAASPNLIALGSESDQNIISNVLVPITGLSIELEANMAYKFEFFAGFSQTSITPDVQTKFSYDGTTSFVSWAGHFATTIVWGQQLFTDDFDANAPAALAANDRSWMMNYGTLRTLTAGTLIVEAQQSNTDAGNPTVIRAGSAYLMVTPLGSTI